MKLFLLPLLAFLSLPLSVFAQDKVYSPLVDLSNAGQGNDVQTFEGYINFLYGMSIAVAALLAVIKIIIAGTKYMLDDVISGKEDAKKDIQGAVLGLLLILSAVIILELINPQLINREIKFDELAKRPELKAPALTAANPDGSVDSLNPPVDTTGRLRQPVITALLGADRGSLEDNVGCIGILCLEHRFAKWEGTIYTYNISAHCDDYVKNDPNAPDYTRSEAYIERARNQCLSSVKRMMNEPYSGVCVANGASDVVSYGGSILACQFPHLVRHNKYYEDKFNRELAGQQSDTSKTEGVLKYDASTDFKRMCEKDVVDEKAGTFKQVESDSLTFSPESYRCVWYN